MAKLIKLNSLSLTYNTERIDMKDGFININKPAGMTSHDVVNKLRRILGTKKVGHAGTLDPFATGVLPIAVGRATKFLEYLSNFDKSYRAEILFGIETDTGDITGTVVDQISTKAVLERNTIINTLKVFSGTITQTPPKYSAIKINGRKAYELARKNIDFELPSREVNIYKIEIVGIGENTLTIDVDCSKGTYIRSLAVDIGHSLGISATLRSLHRTRFGNFSIEGATVPEEAIIVSTEECLKHLPRFNLPSFREKAFESGLTTTIHSGMTALENLVDGTTFRVYVEDRFIGTGKVIDGELKAAKMYRQTNSC